MTDLPFEPEPAGAEQPAPFLWKNARAAVVITALLLGIAGAVVLYIMNTDDAMTPTPEENAAAFPQATQASEADTSTVTHGARYAVSTREQLSIPDILSSTEVDIQNVPATFAPLLKNGYTSAKILVVQFADARSGYDITYELDEEFIKAYGFFVFGLSGGWRKTSMANAGSVGIIELEHASYLARATVEAIPESGRAWVRILALAR